MKKYHDGLSRQRRYQLRHKELGLCAACSGKVFRSGLCEKHYSLLMNGYNRKVHKIQCPCCGSYYKPLDNKN